MSSSSVGGGDDAGKLRDHRLGGGGWLRCAVVVRAPYYARPVLLAPPALLKLSVITVISPINRLARAAAPPGLSLTPPFPHIFLACYSTTEPRERQPTNRPTILSLSPSMRLPDDAAFEQPPHAITAMRYTLSLAPRAVCATVCTRLNALPSTIPPLYIRCDSLSSFHRVASSSLSSSFALRPFDFARVNATTLARVTRATRNPTSGFANDARTPPSIHGVRRAALRASWMTVTVSVQVSDFRGRLVDRR